MKNFTSSFLLNAKKWLLIIPVSLSFTLVGCEGMNLDAVTSLASGFVPGGVTVGEVEKAAEQYYEQAMSEAKLMGEKNAQTVRLRRIANKLIPYTAEYNPRAANWKWEVNLINDPDTLNAWCMAGGKIAFYTGIINKLKLTDDEIAMIMGHEMTHALKEHVYYQMNKEALVNYGTSKAIEGADGKVGDWVKFGANMLNLTFSREDEKVSDLIGQELGARAGYNPKAAVSVWKKFQNLGSGSGKAMDEYFSTHPNDANRIQYLEENLPKVMPLYEEARRRK